MASRSRSAFLLFFISPFLALLSAIFSYRSGWAQNIAWGFVVFYGFTMSISNTWLDANRYRDKFLVMAQGQESLSEFIPQLYSTESGYTDVVQPFTSFLVSKFTSNYRIFFAVLGFIFGYFYSRNIWFLLKKQEHRLKLGNAILLITFACIIGFWNLNGFRFWTAAHVFFFGSFSYFSTGKIKGVFIAIFSALIHFSFLFPIAILILYWVFGNRLQFYFWLFLISLFISELDLNMVNQYLTDFLPDVFNKKVNSYTDVDYAISREKQLEVTSWHVAYYGNVLKWTLVSFIFLIWFKSIKSIRGSNFLLSIFSFSLLIAACSNVAGLIPSGNRFVVLSNLFLCAAVFLFFQYTPRKQLVHKIMPLAVPALIFYCLVAIRTGLDTLGVMTILGNPILALFGNIDTALVELIK